MKKSPNQIHRLFALCMLMMFFGSIQAFAQQITGKVTDESKEAIPGATIMVQGNSEVGTITDMDGNYVLEVPDASNDVIIVSFIGMESQTIPVAGKTVINVVLTESFTALDEVVAIGYGTVKKKDLTGAVASIDNEKLKENPVSNVAEAMQGKLSGVSIATQDGRPGADVTVRIRGGGSITQSNDPLIVIDGVPSAGSLSDIPASQIESIDVLKDASSTAIYGARGANGVILVTTKGLNTKEGTVRVSYSGYYQIKSIAQTLEPMNAQEYVLHQWSYGTAYGNNAGTSAEGFFGLGVDNGNNYGAYANVAAHDYTNDLIRDSYQQDHNISIASSSEKTIFAFNANINDDKGIKIKSGFQRQQMAFKIQQKLADNLKVGFDLRYTQTKQEGYESARGGRGSILSSAYMFNPIDNPLGDGDFTDYNGWGNGDVNLDPTYDPYVQTMRIENFSYRQKFNALGYIDWEIINGLKARYEISGLRNYGENQFYNEEVAASEKNANLSLSRQTGWRSAATVNYEVQNLDQHSLSFLVGTEAQYGQTNTTRIDGRGYPDYYDFEKTMANIQDVTYYETISVADPNDPTKEIASINKIRKENFNFYNNIGVASTTLSYFGRANYSFKERYLLQASVRADGSSKFAPNNRWGYFPAGSAGWRISEEPFMEGTRNWLDNLKLRLSYGESGNDGIPYYAWNELLYSIDYNSDGEKIINNGDYFPNENLRWETTVSRNVGFDLNMFNSRVNLNLEYYSNYTKDLLGAIKVDGAIHLGRTLIYNNVGQTSNKGFEVGVNVDVIRNQDFTFSVSGTYNYNKSNIDKLDPRILNEYYSGWAGSVRQPNYDFVFSEGKPVGNIQAFVSEGYYKPEDFEYTVDETTGDFMYTLKEGIPYYGTQITNNYPSPFRNKVRALDYEKDADGVYVRDENGNPVVRTDANGDPVYVQLNDVFPGALKIKDANGDSFIDNNDVTELGQMAPKHTGGFALNATYKGFDFNASFAYALGGQVLNVNRALNSYGNKDNTIGANRLSYVNDSYKVYDVNTEGNLEPVTSPAELNALNANATSHVPYYEMGVLLSSHIEKNDYLRLNALTLGYSIPKTITQKVSIERVRVYFTGGNLFVLTNYSGLDPEVNTKAQSGSYPTPGMDFGAYPRSRTFTFGLNVDF